ncbi:hypothetical protein EVAR_18151_1 [Eumeta japonica]|uniref:Uncharacterized protein n=1 Tax=Eumeta variegata TaxID=151549 RepID=A0A4C1UWI4_EUMVA|nr:hypothetical protein EVAR_18151_1 [Eumeta japonica]
MREFSSDVPTGSHTALEPRRYKSVVRNKKCELSEVKAEICAALQSRDQTRRPIRSERGLRFTAASYCSMQRAQEKVPSALALHSYTVHCRRLGRGGRGLFQAQRARAFVATAQARPARISSKYRRRLEVGCEFDVCGHLAQDVTSRLSGFAPNLPGDGLSAKSFEWTLKSDEGPTAI